MLGSRLCILRYSAMYSSGVGSFAFCNRMSVGVAPGASNTCSGTRGLAIGSCISDCGSSCDGRLSSFEDFEVFIEYFV